MDGKVLCTVDRIRLDREPVKHLPFNQSYDLEFLELFEPQFTHLQKGTA